MRRRKRDAITITLIKQRTRWEALDLLIEVTNAMNAGKFGTACELLGMDETLFTDLTIEEVAQAANVRLADLAREAGVKIGDTK